MILLQIIGLLSAVPGLAREGGGFAGPDGWRIMCADTPDYCNTTAPRDPPSLDRAALARIAAVNAAVNEAIRPLDEPPGEDVWRLEPLAGDCEDYALTKKARLIAEGFAAERLRFATALTEGDELHAVLLVDHADGRLVLDNRFAEPREWQAVEAMGYRLIAVEGLAADGGWQVTPYGTLVALLARHAPAAAH